MRTRKNALCAIKLSLFLTIALVPVLILVLFCGCKSTERIVQWDYTKASPEMKLVKRIQVQMKDGSQVIADEKEPGKWVEAPAFPGLEDIKSLCLVPNGKG